MTRAFRFTLNAALIWVAGSTFWYSCVLKDVCLPDPPPEGFSFSLPMPAVAIPGPATPHAPVKPPSDKPLSFAWNAIEPVKGTNFDKFRTDLLKQQTADSILEITGIYYAGERGSDLGVARAQKVQELFADRVPGDKIRIASRGDRATAEQRTLFEAVTIRWVSPSSAKVAPPPPPPPTAPIAMGAQPASATRILVYFQTGAVTQTLDPDTLAQLRTLAAEAQRNGKTVVITGHTDNRGDEAGNIALGLTRATTIRDYLAATVVPPPEMKVESEGPRQPIASNDNEEGRARNRRVEVSVQ